MQKVAGANDEKSYDYLNLDRLVAVGGGGGELFLQFKFLDLCLDCWSFACLERLHCRRGRLPKENW